MIIIITLLIDVYNYLKVSTFKHYFLKIIRKKNEKKVIKKSSWDNFTLYMN